MILERPRPRFVVPRVLKNGETAFYFVISKYYRKLGCTIPNEPLGTDYEAACGKDGKSGRAAILNGLFDEWEAKRKGEPVDETRLARYGTIDWLFRRYKTEDAYTEKVSSALARTTSVLCRWSAIRSTRAASGSASA